MSRIDPVHIRKASEADAEEIIALVRSERLNPNDLHWSRFIVAVSGGRIIGAVQMRRHRGGGLELGSLVVSPARRGEGIACRMIDALLASEAQAVSTITGREFADHYRPWGFVPISPWRASPLVLRNYVLGQSIGAVHALWTGRPVKRLVILERPATATVAESIACVTQPYGRGRARGSRSA